MSNLPNLRPPQAPVVFTTDPSTLLAEIEKANAKVKQVLDDLVANVEAEDATFENVLLPIMLADNEWSNMVRLLKFPASSSPDKALRDASRDVAKIIRRFESDYFTREDIFLLVDAVMQRADNLDPEQQYCLEKRHQAYILNGLGLTDQKQREHFKAIQTRLKDCVAECGKNMNEASGGIWFSPQDLDGLAPEIIGNLQQGEEGEHAGKAFLTFKRPDLTAALTLVRVEATRKAIWIGSENKCMENVPLIKEIFELRDEAARLLGYPNHSAMKIADKMMKSPDAVHAFLQDLRERTTPRGKTALEELVQLKKEDLRERGLQVPEDEKVYLWDYNYYSAKLKEQKVSLNMERLLEYMPLEPVLAGMFDIYERLFGTRFVPLRFDETKGSLVEQKVTWHPDVRVFEVWDADEEGSFLGYLYLDMHPRFGKYSHQAHYRLQRVRAQIISYNVEIVSGLACITIFSF